MQAHLQLIQAEKRFRCEHNRFQARAVTTKERKLHSQLYNWHCDEHPGILYVIFNGDEYSFKELALL